MGSGTGSGLNTVPPWGVELGPGSGSSMRHVKTTRLEKELSWVSRYSMDCTLVLGIRERWHRAGYASALGTCQSGDVTRPRPLDPVFYEKRVGQGWDTAAPVSPAASEVTRTKPGKK